jgi:hypothetical protein
MPAGPKLCHRRTQALYIKERNHHRVIGAPEFLAYRDAIHFMYVTYVVMLGSSGDLK